MRKTATHTHGLLATLVALDHRVDPTSDPTSELLIVSMQPPAPASSLAEPPPAASPQLGRWICQAGGLRSARMRCLLLLLRRRLLSSSSCFFTFGHISYWSHDNSRASYYYCIYFLSMQSPALVSSLHLCRAASGSKPTTGTVDLSAMAATRENAGSAAGACCCQCCCCRCCICCCRCCR